jgi:hypothetical protein
MKRTLVLTVLASIALHAIVFGAGRFVPDPPSRIPDRLVPAHIYFPPAPVVAPAHDVD